MKLLLGSQSPRRRDLLSGLDIPFECVRIDADESYPADLQGGDIPLYIAREKAAAYLERLQQDELLLTADTIVWVEGRMLGKPKDAAEARAMLRLLSGRTHQVFTAVTLTYYPAEDSAPSPAEKSTTFAVENSAVIQDKNTAFPEPLPNQLRTNSPKTTEPTPTPTTTIHQESDNLPHTIRQDSHNTPHTIHQDSHNTPHTIHQETFVDCTDVTFRVLTEQEIDYYIDRYRPFDKAGAYGVQEYIGYIGVEKIVGSYYNIMGLPIDRVYLSLLPFLPLL